MQLVHPATPTVPALKVLRVMPEYLSSGLWRPRDEHVLNDQACTPVRECDPEKMGLSPSLVERLQAWCCDYERLDVGRPDTTPDLTLFAAKGLAIARALQVELPEVAVWYFDEAMHDQGCPRQAYLYRV